MYDLVIGWTTESHQNKYKKSGKAQNEDRKRTTLFFFETWCVIGMENETMTAHIKVLLFERCVSISHSLLN